VPDERHPDAGELAAAVAAIRLQAERRSRQAEVDRARAAVQEKEQARRAGIRRRLVVSGSSLLVPVLILLISSWQGNCAVGEASQQLTEQRAASNRDSARIVASALRRNQRLRIDRVREAALAGSLVRALSENDRAAMERFLDAELLLGPGGKPSGLFTFAWMTDRRGRILAIKQTRTDGDGGRAHTEALVPAEVHARHKQFTWRDWFSGGGERSGERDEVWHPMVNGLHLSDPYVSVVPAAGPVFAVSTPIRSRQDGEPAGLLGASVTLLAVNDWLRDAGRLSDGGEIFVLNRARGGSRSLLAINGTTVAPKLAAPSPYPDLEDALARSEHGSLYGHVDPADGRTYTVGYARTDTPGGVGHSDWVVLVRHEKEQVTSAVTTLRERTWRSSLLTFAVTAAIMAAQWGWVLWLLRPPGGEPRTGAA
jgi:hypothetical protein